jgi:hypothetical protein
VCRIEKRLRTRTLTLSLSQDMFSKIGKCLEGFQTVFHRMGQLYCEMAPESTIRPSKHGEPSKKYYPAQGPVPVQLEGVEASTEERACTVGPFTAAETFDMEPPRLPMIHGGRDSDVRDLASAASAPGCQRRAASADGSDPMPGTASPRLPAGNLLGWPSYVHGLFAIQLVPFQVCRSISSDGGQSQVSGARVKTGCVTRGLRSEVVFCPTTAVGGCSREVAKVGAGE